MTNTLDFQKEEPDLTQEQKVQYIIDNWKQIETSLVLVPETDNLVKKLNDYIDDLKKEMKSIKKIRWIVSIFALTVIIFLLGVLGYFLLCAPLFLTQNQSYSGTAFIVTSISASVLLLIALIRGAYRSVQDRNKYEQIPPHLIQTAETVQGLVGST